MSNSRDRFIQALYSQKTDRIPRAYVAAFTNRELQEKTGCFMPEVHTDGKKMFTLCSAVHEELGFDGVTFIINAFNSPAALGCKMDWGTPERLPMYLSHPWKSPRDVENPDDLLNRIPIRNYLESIRYARKNYSGRVAVIGKVLGPLTMTQVMFGVENTMTGLIDHPELIRESMKRITDIQVRCANAQFEEGIDALSIGEGGAGANMISPEMYDRYLKDIHQDMTTRIKGPTIMHICGNITTRMESLKDVGFDCFNFDWAIQPSRMKTAADGKFSLMGNISTTDLLTASPETIREQVAENIAAGIDIISPGCAISPLCPTENLRALVSSDPD